jgi:hypothetical protein
VRYAKQNLTMEISVLGKSQHQKSINDNGDFSVRSGFGAMQKLLKFKSFKDQCCSSFSTEHT